MRLSFSNLAWDVGEDEAVARLLHQYDVDAVDIVPTKYFSAVQHASLEDVRHLRTWWTDRGIEPVGMQALLYGTEGLNVFATANVQQAMLDHLRSVCRIGGELGATRLVFGSPRNRDRTGLTDEAAQAVAVDFFRRLGDIARASGVVMCIEPNPPAYSCNFVTDAAQAARLVAAVDHPAIRMQLDIGAITMNGEDVAAVAQHYAPLIGHVHASEPDLVPLGDGAGRHDIAGHAVRLALPDHIVTIEMIATRDEAHLAAMERALGVAVRHYRKAAPREAGR
jgi:D-psicose/D-tagatose/L-ribulose 3-epimerase